MALVCIGIIIAFILLIYPGYIILFYYNYSLQSITGRISHMSIEQRQHIIYKISALINDFALDGIDLLDPVYTNKYHPSAKALLNSTNDRIYKIAGNLTLFELPLNTENQAFPWAVKIMQFILYAADFKMLRKGIYEMWDVLYNQIPGIDSSSYMKPIYTN